MANEITHIVIEETIAPDQIDTSEFFVYVIVRNGHSTGAIKCSAGLSRDKANALVNNLVFVLENVGIRETRDLNQAIIDINNEE